MTVIDDALAANAAAAASYDASRSGPQLVISTRVIAPARLTDHEVVADDDKAAG